MPTDAEFTDESTKGSTKEPTKESGAARTPDPSSAAMRRVALAIGLALVAWSGACARGGFSFDDAEAIFDNPYVAGELPWSEALLRDYWHHRGDAGQWRPSALASLRIDYGGWAESALGYHATNVALHALVVLLAGLVLSRLPGRRGALAGLLVFAVHPVLADSVAWISGRTSMLAAAGGLLGLVYVQRARGTIGLALAAASGLALALAGKEDGLAFALPLVVVAGASGDRRTRQQRVLAAGLGLGLACVLVARLRAEALGLAWPHAPHAPLTGASLATRLAVSGRAWLEGLRLAVLPFGYPPAYGATELARVPSPGAWPPSAWIGAAFWIGTLVAVLVALVRRSPVALSFLCCTAALLPTSQLVPAGEIFAPRFLYLPLLFAIPLIDACATRLPRPLFAGLLVAYIALAWERAGVYADRASFSRRILAHVPADPGSWNDLGLAYEEQGRPDAARDAWARATRVDPTYGRAWSNLGRLALADGDLDAAEEAFARAVARGAANPIAHVNLASLHLRRERPSAAVEHYARATELAPGLVPAWRGLAHALWRLGRTDAAVAALERALELDPADALSRALAERLRDPAPR